mgnify:CR=1 FL=1|tara:strand:+ start:597 stop:869 length:273 start_codon:yes stop_codon:yes gene_type:complete
MSKSKIPKRITEELEEISQYAGSCDDWMTIKKEVMRSIPPNLRALFSRRDPITKEQNPNEFDMEVIEYYKSLTGVSLKIRTLEERRKLND